MKERAGVKQLRRGKNLETLTNPWVDSSFSPYLFHGLSSYRFSVSRFGLIPETTVRGRQPPLSFQKNRIVGEGTIRKRPERLGWTLITATLNSRRWVVEKKKEKKTRFHEITTLRGIVYRDTMRCLVYFLSSSGYLNIGRESIRGLQAIEQG